jgi:3-(3-hydroxy-phenyl)propionate hydroxylase
MERAPTPPDDPRAATPQPPTIAMLHDLGTGPSLIEQALKVPPFQFRGRTGDAVLAKFDNGRLAGKTEFPFAI